jgi:hypothetical protein
MIELEINERDDLVIATPSGALTADDISAMAAKINDFINEHDRVPNLVLHAKSLPHWKDFDALKHHLKLVRDHHKLVKKVAIVSDRKLIWLLRPIADQFTGAKLRRFPERAYDDAVNWAKMEDDHPGEFVLIDGLPSDVVGIDARGLITAQDYDNFLSPLIQTKLEKHDKLNFLFVAGNYFDGYSGGALWDDAKFGLMHMRSFSKVALVTDVKWLRHGAKLFSPLIPADVMVFGLEELDDAKEWIKT